MVLCAGAGVGSAQAPKVHRLEATPATVAYGHYWAETKPVLTINSGDIIDVDTLLTSTPARLEQSGVAAADVQASLRAIVDTVKDRGPGGHILTGPVFVTGAEPGDALEVKVLSIDLPIAYGYNGCSGFVRENCEPGRGQTIIPLDRKNMTATFLPGVVIPLRPFFGSMGVAPPLEVGRVSSNPPSTHAGNLDNKELVAGTTLFIPIHVRGALFEVGDGHAAQGDGEVDQTGLETSLRGRLQLTVRKGMKLAWPRAETDLYYISMGTDVDLTKATKVAIQEMIDFLAATKKMDKHQAYQLTSLAGDVAITQLVDGTMGVHVKMPKNIFKITTVQSDGSGRRFKTTVHRDGAGRRLGRLFATRRTTGDDGHAETGGLAARRHYHAAWRSLPASRRHRDDERRDALRSGVRQGRQAPRLVQQCGARRSAGLGGERRRDDRHRGRWAPPKRCR